MVNSNYRSLVKKPDDTASKIYELPFVWSSDMWRSAPLWNGIPARRDPAGNGVFNQLDHDLKKLLHEHRVIRLR